MQNINNIASKRFKNEVSKRGRIIRIALISAVLIPAIADFSIIKFANLQGRDMPLMAIMLLLLVFGIMASLAIWAGTEDIIGYYLLTFVLNAFWIAWLIFITNKYNFVFQIAHLVATIVFTTAISILAIVVIYQTIKWINWNGYSKCFIAVTLKGNIKRINKYTNCSVDPYATKDEIFVFLVNHHDEIIKSKKFYQIW